ncbi:MAG: cysteine--tRNA ligase [Eubacteriales bacterium]|nr:cysteine--tRNA ligase [Eubacteriales bacterium]
MRVYNDLTRQKEELRPQVEGKIQIYVCGPTVYDYFHLGNARPFVVYDTLRRYLEYRGYEVEYVQNFTDIEDKIITRAKVEGITPKELSERMIVEYFKDADGLNIKRATVHPKATETIPEIIDLISDLFDNGYAYTNDDGVYFDIAKFPDYGKLSRHSLEDLEEGASHRLAEDRQKRNPFDFVLWKFQKDGEVSWPSPWGDGRPGWHIECSAMSRKHLGKTIDIHCGGQDLIFPHHENEIAQSEAANGVPFVNYWLHNGFINVDNEKMAKSAGNFFRVRDLVEKYSYELLRFFILQPHYRMPINFSAELLDAAEHGWERIKTCVANLDFLLEQDVEAEDQELSASLAAATAEARENFIKAMDDDLNTAEAFAAIFELVREVNTLVAKGQVGKSELSEARAMIQELLGVLGLSAAVESTEISAEVLAKLEARQSAKEAKNWAEADRLRDEILAAGFRVEDTAQGPKLVPVEAE